MYGKHRADWVGEAISHGDLLFSGNPVLKGVTDDEYPSLTSPFLLEIDICSQPMGGIDGSLDELLDRELRFLPGGTFELATLARPIATSRCCMLSSKGAPSQSWL